MDISKAFHTSGEPLTGLLQRPGAGFYIPLYQREYSWDRDNIEQLMDDIMRGVEVSLSDAEAIRFLGTLILVTEKRPYHSIEPKDPRALPQPIFNVIDGQQRLSTVALLACLLHQRLTSLHRAIREEALRGELNEAVDAYTAELIEMFSVDLKRGTPRRKPVIIRGSVDSWTFDGSDENYRSDIAAYLAGVIRAIDGGTAAPKARVGTLVARNVNAMGERLGEVETAHKDADGMGYPAAWLILEHMSEERLWSYPRPTLVARVMGRAEPPTADEGNLCSLVQLFAFCRFLLEGCCFTLIEPVSDDWAFDMFQSLNATGTPLTALETFKPLVVNRLVVADKAYKGSATEAHFSAIDTLVNQKGSSAHKNKQTNDLLTAFAAAREGYKLSTQFSQQRKWLQKRYDELPDDPAREEFIRQMGDHARYWQQVVQNDPAAQPALPGTVGVPDAEVGAVCAMYLQDAGHTMAHTVLARFYAGVLRERDGAAESFVGACKAVAAFYTLWRAVLPNTGLDDVYRRMLRDDLSWEKGDDKLTVEQLRARLVMELKNRKVGTRAQWHGRAVRTLRYDHAKTVCRFALFVGSHETMADPDVPGLMIAAKAGYAPYLLSARWRSPDLRSVEHVAPQNPPEGHTWDPDLYRAGEYQQIGNLVLLPSELNASAANKSWLAKFIYYGHLAEANPAAIGALETLARERGVTLAREATERLRNANHAEHMRPIATVGIDGSWNLALVEARTARTCDLLWDRMTTWLGGIPDPAE